VVISELILCCSRPRNKKALGTETGVGVYCRPVDDAHPFDALRLLCSRLRAPGGCPWDRAQTLGTLKTYLLEETYELLEALEREDPDALATELGDLLFQVVFVADMAADRGWFDILDVCRGIEAKMVRRHPHVFGDVQVSGADDVVRRWERIKESENHRGGALGGVPSRLPALLKALRITEKAAALGFDWPHVTDVAGKVAEEVRELAEAVSSGCRRNIRAELGDVLFSVANLARHLGADPEDALQGTNATFSRRFSAMEGMARQQGTSLTSLSPEQMDVLWRRAKEAEQAEAVLPPE
jgi:MazG family protein